MMRLTCTQFNMSIEGFADGSCTPSESLLMNEHLNQCPQCAHTWQMWSTISQSMASYTPPQLPPLVERHMIVSALGPQGHSETASKSNSKWIKLAGLAAAAIVLVGIGFFYFQSERRLLPNLPLIIPQNTAPSASSDPYPVAVITEDGRQLLPVDSHTDVWITQGSHMQIESLAPNRVVIRLHRGQVLANIKTHPPGYKFTILTPRGEMHAKGTIFTVLVDKNGQETTRVLEGTVEVRGANPLNGPIMSILVGEGQETSTGSTHTSPISKVKIHTDLCLMNGCPSSHSTDSANWAKSQIGRPTNEAPISSLNLSSSLDTSSSIPAPSPIVKSSPVVKSPRGKRSTESTSSKEPSNGLTVTELVSLALKQRKQSDYVAAAQTYRTLIQQYPNSTAANNAKVSLGRLELVELSNPITALTYFKDYIETSPAGILAQEARLGLVRAHRRLGKHTGTIQWADQYIQHHPSGYAGSEVFLSRGNAHRHLGNCKDATADYLQLQSAWPGSKEYIKAAQGLIACQQK